MWLRAERTSTCWRHGVTPRRSACAFATARVSELDVTTGRWLVCFARRIRSGAAMDNAAQEEEGNLLLPQSAGRV